MWNQSPGGPPSDRQPPRSARSRPRVRLGAYEPLLELAAGGMATVYIARQLGAAGFQRLVVIKRVHRHLLGDREFYDMFIDEARVASQIRHPNVVSVTDVVEAEGELFLVMDYVESSSLHSLLTSAQKRGDRLSPPIAARIVADVLAGLHAAHDACDMQGRPLDVVHRDVSPQNILIGLDGVSRLIDFGIAKAAHRISETRSGSFKGKVGYVSPEGARSGPIDRRADIFAAGIILHEALTAKRLFVGKTDFDTLRQVFEHEPPLPSSLAPEIPPALDAVTKRALALSSSMRFQTAAAFLEALEAAVPIASAREVRAALEDHCGEHLAARRAELRTLLDESEPSPSVRRSASILPRASGETPLDAELGSEGQIDDFTAPYGAPPPRRELRAETLIGAALACVLLMVIFVFVFTRPRSTGPVVTIPMARPTALAEASKAPPRASAASAAEEIEVVLIGDQPIESVRAKGLRRVVLEGQRAQVFITPWHGSLPIEAALAGGRIAVAHADVETARAALLELRLPSSVPSAPRPPRLSAPRPPRPTVDPELHSSPYEQP